MITPPRRHRPGEESGLDDWLMTYADMITLLLCFFAVFLSVSVPKKEIFDQAREKVLERFADNQDEDSKIISLAPPPPPALPPGLNDPRSGGLNDAFPSFVDLHHLGEGKSTREREGIEGENTGQEEKIEKIEEKPPGDRILTLEIPSAAFFASGSATLSAEGQTILLEILKNQLNASHLQDYTITIEGHTDDAPIKTLQFPSNWELSTARAASVVRFFIEQGFPPARLRASGYADTFPKLPNRDASGSPIPGNQAENRRVLIKMEKIEKLLP
ncbi:MAG: flagellar motor protein MotB [Alphaproteobacteria bacterium]|nr:flagellar motor protein MotB [Alphaproteobacteria bacterium]